MWDIFNKKKVQALKEETEYLKGQIHILKEDREKGKNEIEHLEEEVSKNEKNLSWLNVKINTLETTKKNLSEDVEAKSQALDHMLDDFKSLLVQNKDKGLDCSGIRVAKEVAKEVADINTYNVHVKIYFFGSYAGQFLRHFKSFIDSKFSQDGIVEHSMFTKVNSRGRHMEEMMAKFTIHTFNSNIKIESDLLNFLYEQNATIFDQEDKKEGEINIVGRVSS